jgi:hypothetical protein
LQVEFAPGRLMGALWAFVSKPENQKTLSWFGGGLVVLAGGAWAVFTYVWPHEGPSSDGPKVVCPEPGAIAAGRDANGNTIIINGNAQIATGAKQAPCVEAGKRQ